MRSAHDISYDEWIDDVFVHAYPRFAGVEHEDGSNPASVIEANAAANLQFLARLFRESGALLNRYTPDQIGLGFNYLIFNACSNNAFVLTDLSLPLDQRVACVLSIADVYRDCFQQICKPYLGHRERDGYLHPDSNEANGVCYMWWDLLPIRGAVSPRHRWSSPDAAETDPHLRLNRACLDAMAQSLEIDHVACLEGTLHGLGHWHFYCPGEVEHIIDEFLAERSNLPRDLLEYARGARIGGVE